MADDVLQGYRKSIDNIDAALVHLLAERFKVTQAVGRHKAVAGLPAADPGREERQIARLRQLAAPAVSGYAAAVATPLVGRWLMTSSTAFVRGVIRGGSAGHPWTDSTPCSASATACYTRP